MRALQKSRNILSAPDGVRAAVNALVGRDCGSMVRENPSDVVLPAPALLTPGGALGNGSGHGLRDDGLRGDGLHYDVEDVAGTAGVRP